MLLFLLLAMWLRMAQTLCLSIKFRESLRSSCLWEKKTITLSLFFGAAHQYGPHNHIWVRLYEWQIPYDPCRIPRACPWKKYTKLSR